jgi:hypothetical protein
MLYTEFENRIMAEATQPNMRKSYSADTFFSVYGDFFQQSPLTGKHVLDFGPGQCDFLDICKNAGAITTGFDVDKAVCQLGMVRGHRMINGDIRKNWPIMPGSLDGLFCRGSFNPYWFAKDLPALARVMETMLASVKPTGWIWFVPWDRPYPEDAAANPGVVKAVEAALKSHKVALVTPSPAAILRYGAKYDIPKTTVWVRNIANAAAMLTAVGAPAPTTSSAAAPVVASPPKVAPPPLPRPPAKSTNG